MKSFKSVSESRFLWAGQAVLTGMQSDRSARGSSNQKIPRAMLLVLVIAVLGAVPVRSRSQSLTLTEDSSATATVTAPAETNPTYVRPTERTKVEQLRFRRIRSLSHCRRCIRGWNQSVGQRSSGVEPGR